MFARWPRPALPAVLLGGVLVAGSAAGSASDPPPSPLPASRQLDDLRARQQAGPLLLSGVSRVLPELVWLDRITYSPGTLVIEGRTYRREQIDAFLAALGQLPGLSKPVLLETHDAPPDDPKDVEQDPAPILAFSLRLSPDGSAPSEAGGQAKPVRAADLGKAVQRVRSLIDPETFKVERLAADPAAEAEGPLRVTQLHLQAQAAGFHPVALFFDRLSRSPDLVALRAMTLESIRPTPPKNFRLALLLTLEIAASP